MPQVKKEHIEWLGDNRQRWHTHFGTGRCVKEVDLTRLFEEAKKAFGTFNILPHNTIIQQYLPNERASVAAFYQHYDVNILGPTFFIQAALKPFFSIPIYCKVHRM